MKTIATNKTAHRDYEILKTYEAWIVLLGHEVKSLKTMKCSLREGIIKESDKNLFLVGVDIPQYKHTSVKQIGYYESKRRRKLLLNKRELAKIIIRTQQDKLQIIPLKIYIGKYGKLKVAIWLAKRLRKVMKKQKIKEKDQARQMDKSMKHLGI